MTEYVTHEELETLLEPIRQDIHTLSLEVDVLKEDVHQLSLEVGVLREDVHQLSLEVGVLKEDVHQLSLEVGVLKEDVHQLRKGNVDIKNQLAGLVLGQSHAVRLIAMLMTPEQRDTARELGIPI